MAIRTTLRGLLASDRGATAIEYGLIVALIAVACVGALTELGVGSGSIWGGIQSDVDAAM